MKGIIQPLASSGLAIPLALIACLAGAFQSAAPPARRAAQTADQAAAASPPAVPLALDARAIFEDKCATCHGSDGRAKTFKAKFNKARDLTGAAWQAEASDERIYNSIANGRGRKMPAFAKKLSRAEIEGLVGLVRSLKK